MIALGLSLAGCAGQDDSDLWRRTFPSAAPATDSQSVTGYWEGRVYAGDIRLKIEPASIVAALKCDVHGETVTVQGSAPILLKTFGRPTIVLQQELKAERKGCGFGFAGGKEVAYALDGQGTLKLDFAGTGATELRKLANLPVDR